MAVSIHVTSNLSGIAARLWRKASVVGSEVRTVSATNASDLQRRVRAHAQGRPGPRRIFGNYWASIQPWIGDDGISFGVTSDAPQANRLEFGFVGTDSLDRVYDQPPFPHYRPAFDELRPLVASRYAAKLGLI